MKVACNLFGIYRNLTGKFHADLNRENCECNHIQVIFVGLLKELSFFFYFKIHVRMKTKDKNASHYKCMSIFVNLKTSFGYPKYLGDNMQA